LRAGGLWLTYNAAITESFSHFGSDMDRWFWVSGAGYAGSPSFQMVQNVWGSFEDSPEGRRARGDLLRTPANFVPGSIAIRSMLKAMEDDEYWDSGKGRPGSSFWRLLGAKPVNELDEDRDIVEWLEEELNALFQIKGTEMDEQEEIIDKIHKAFQDVVIKK
ncbi:hypothetical protein LCGC14_2131870, partial [marine sediment metagenome]